MNKSKNRVKATALSLIALMLVFNLPAKTFAWGNEGHKIVANIATRLLTPQARNQVEDILASNESLVSVALWADSIRGEEPGKRPETPNWHFVSIPLGKTYRADRDCIETPNGSCVISALVIFQAVLAQKRKGYFDDDFNRYEALKFITHFAGDIHQPLHNITDFRNDEEGDRGGNDKKVVWFGSTGKKLHGVWDTDILKKNMESQTNATINAYADFLFNSLTQTEKNMANPPNSTTPSVVSRATIEVWSRDAHIIAENAYSDIGSPNTSGAYSLAQPYYNSHRAQVDNQLKLAGIRLARILNENLR